MEEIKEEIWVPAVYIFENDDIVKFPKYKVSDMGRVKSLQFRKVRVLKHCTTCRNGALWNQVVLYKDHKRYPLSVHRLVLSSFRPKGHRDGYFSGAVVDHIDARTGSDCDDSLNNLHWVTIRDNTSTDHCKIKTSESMLNHPSLSKRVKVIFSDGTQRIFPSAKEAGRALGLPHRTPANCINKYNGFYKKLNIHFEYIK